MDKIILENIKPFSTLKTDVTYIVIQAVDSIPPHISLINKGQYFSVSARKVLTNKDASITISKINRSKIPTLFVALKTLISDTIINQNFENSTPLTKGTSCLQPILNSCEEAGIQTNNAAFIFELIPFLNSNLEVQDTFHLNCDAILLNNSLPLNTYGVKEVEQAIFNTIQLAKI